MAAVAPVAIVGVGMTAIIVTGGIDVSVGSAVAVVMVVVGQLVRRQRPAVPPRRGRGRRRRGRPRA